MEKYYQIDEHTVKMDVLYKGNWISTYFDTEDYDKVKMGTWRILVKPNGTMYVRGRVPGMNGTVLLHRYLMGNVKGVIDHEDRDSLNNRKGNLSDTTQTINVRNRTVTNPTGVHGVFPTPSGKYRVRIKVAGKLKNIGTFDTLELAILARKGAEKLLW